MEFFLRFLQCFLKFLYVFVYAICRLLLPRQKSSIPPIKDELLTLSLVRVMKEMRGRKLKSERLVSAYIERIKAIDPFINAVVEERFEAALKDAQRVDGMVANARNELQLLNLFAKYPLLGVPFTVKESCGLKDMSHVVGSLGRRGKKSSQNGHVVELLCAAGAIPLLVSANPEYCFSIETHTHTHGKCCNPYDARRTAGGSSGGEGALNGAAGTLFGIGSDIGGSIRIPCHFNGVFGHKPTAGLTSVKGHFPHSDDPHYEKYLQVGPIARYACDLGVILQIIAGHKAPELDLLHPVETNSIKIYYSLGFEGLNGFLHQAVDMDIEFAIIKACKYFQQKGLAIATAKLEGFRNSLEISLSALVRLQNFPYLLPDGTSQYETLKEGMKSLLGRSNYTKDGLIFEMMRRTNGFMPRKNLAKYKHEADALRAELIELLGDNGVLFFPTFHVPAIHHNTSLMPLYGIDYCCLFNILGLPATHVPMGLDKDGLPIGFQVIAAPFKDKLCLQIAGELDLAFGGWVPPCDCV